MITKETRDEIAEIIGSNVTRLLEIKGLRRDEFAKKIGISRVYLSNIENGKHEPSASILFALADALDVPSDTLRQKNISAASEILKIPPLTIVKIPFIVGACKA